MSLEHCDDCTVPPGTRCESAPGNCPYARIKKGNIAKRLRELADTAAALAVDMDYFGGMAEWSAHGRELANAALQLKQWATEIEQ